MWFFVSGTMLLRGGIARDTFIPFGIVGYSRDIPVYCLVNIKVAKFGCSTLLPFTIEFGPRFANHQSVGAGQLAASTCGSENQGNSGFARRGGLETNGTALLAGAR